MASKTNQSALTVDDYFKTKEGEEGEMNLFCRD